MNSQLSPSEAAMELLTRRQIRRYVRGVGLVLTIDRVTGEREELVSIEKTE